MRAAGGRSNARPERAAEGSGGGPVRTGLLRAGCDRGGESETGWGIARLFRYPQVLDVVAPNDEFGQLPEAVAVARGADHVAEADVHPIVAADKVAVVGLAILELDEHRVPLRRSQERERQHHSTARRSGPRDGGGDDECAHEPSAPRGGGKSADKVSGFPLVITEAAFSRLLFLRCRGRSKRGLKSERRVDKLTALTSGTAVSLPHPAFTWSRCPWLKSCRLTRRVGSERRCAQRTDGAAFATIPTTGAATGRLAGRTVRGCSGCGGLVLRLCTPGEVQHVQSVLLGSST